MQLLLAQDVHINTKDEVSTERIKSSCRLIIHVYMYIYLQKGYTPLHYAAIHNSTDCLVLLLSHRANKDAKNKVGHRATSYLRGLTPYVMMIMSRWVGPLFIVPRTNATSTVWRCCSLTALMLTHKITSYVGIRK